MDNPTEIQEYSASIREGKQPSAACSCSSFIHKKSQLGIRQVCPWDNLRTELPDRGTSYDFHRQRIIELEEESRSMALMLDSALKDAQRWAEKAERLRVYCSRLERGKNRVEDDNRKLISQAHSLQRDIWGMEEDLGILIRMC